LRQKKVETFEDQGAVQHPNVSKAPLSPFCFEKGMARPIEENIDGVMVPLKCYAQVSKWVAPEHRGVCALIRRETASGIEVRVLLEGDTLTALVTTKVPQNF
jgi:hypothetical protein